MGNPFTNYQLPIVNVLLSFFNHIGGVDFGISYDVRYRRPFPVVFDTGQSQRNMLGPRTYVQPENNGTLVTSDATHG